MGQTIKYKLPWPELTDSADGPKGFQNLATKTEEILVAETAGKLFIQQSTSAGVNVTTNSDGAVGVDFPTPFKSGTRPAVSVYCLSPNSGAYTVNMYAGLVSGGINNTKFTVKFYIAATGAEAASRTIAIVWSAVGERP